MLTIDGSRYSGSGTIVRQAVAFSALTGKPIHITNARVKRANPGLRPQHVRVVEAISQLVQGKTEGVSEGSQEFTFRPGEWKRAAEYCWDIGSAGSTTMLALAVLPVLAFLENPTSVVIRGGLFQDFAPSFFHLQHVMIPLIHRMGLDAAAHMVRPGYVPTGGGEIHLRVNPLEQSFRPLIQDTRGPLIRVWGIALASHLKERRVSGRMAESAKRRLIAAGFEGDIESQEDTTSGQAGTALALFADYEDNIRLGADQAGAPRRRSEAIGGYVANQLVQDLETGATLDRFAADQIIPFAALAKGESRFRIPQMTDHVETSAWLARTFLDARVIIQGTHLIIHGVGFRPRE